MGLPKGSVGALIKACGDLRRGVKDQQAGAFNFLGPRRRWSKVPIEIWEELRHTWLPSCKYVTNIPSKNETVWMRDISRKIVRCANNKPVLVQKLLRTVPMREIHNELIKPLPVGFHGATNCQGSVLISESALNQKFPTWIVPKTKRYKAMCVCDKCGVSHDVQLSVNLVRSRIVKQDQCLIDGMRDGRRKDILREKLNQYKSEIMNENELKIKKPSHAADMLACEPLEINGIKVHKFACVVRDCQICKDNYKPIQYEVECDSNIKYCLYIGYHQCTWHGDGFLLEDGNVNGKKKFTCTKCDAMSEEEKEVILRNKKPASINTKKFKTRYKTPLHKFMEKGGVYEEQMKSYLCHKFHRTFLGQGMALKMITDYASENAKTAILTNQDHSERYQPEPDGEFQSQHFGKYQSLSMEGYATTYFNHMKQKTVTNFYSVLSDEKRQDAGTVAQNIRMVLHDLLHNQEVKHQTISTLLSVVDGCAVQYRSGSVFHELCQLSVEFGLVYDRLVQASGHGKSIVDSANGHDKTLLDRFFNNLVANPEELTEGVKQVLTHDRDSEGGLVSLSQTCFEILSNPDRRYGAKSHRDRSKNRYFDERRYLRRNIGAASGEGLKYVLKGFQSGEHNGVRAHYNFRADPELLGSDKQICIAVRRFACYCAGCKEKLSQPISCRYSGASKTCIYWDVFKIPDKEEGYNDWKIIDIVPRKKGFNEDDRVARLEVTMMGVGKRMADQVAIGNYGAYIVDDDRYDYYIVKWTEMARKAERDERFEIEGEAFMVKKDEWYAKGIWLELVEQHWWKTTSQSCIVRMQVVVDSDVEMLPISADNQLRSNLDRGIASEARTNNACRISSDDHEFLMKQAVIRSLFDFDQQLDLDNTEGSGTDNDDADVEDEDEDLIRQQWLE